MKRKPAGRKMHLPLRPGDPNDHLSSGSAFWLGAPAVRTSGETLRRKGREQDARRGYRRLRPDSYGPRHLSFTAFGYDIRRMDSDYDPERAAEEAMRLAAASVGLERQRWTASRWPGRSSPAHVRGRSNVRSRLPSRTSFGDAQGRRAAARRASDRQKVRASAFGRRRRGEKAIGQTAQVGLAGFLTERVLGNERGEPGSGGHSGQVWPIKSSTSRTSAAGPRTKWPRTDGDWR